MEDLLHNPVYNALLSGDRHLSFGNDQVKFFDEQVSPFAGFETGYTNGFTDLSDLLPSGRKILYATPSLLQQTIGWKMLHEIKGLQFVYAPSQETEKIFHDIIPLGQSHIDEMVQLAALTKPGPFGLKTIDFGYYFGIFEKENLAAMTGQRLHIQNFTEISAVCTHPDYTGKGYAYSLLLHQLQLIVQQGQQPFLHVREDNERAIALYQRLGFTISRSMNFYFMVKQ